MAERSRFAGWSTSSPSSGGDNGVEVAFAADASVGVRDAQQQGIGPVFECTSTEWDACLGRVVAGGFEPN
jgi:Domain of unknown function (DUF397)